MEGARVVVARLGLTRLRGCVGLGYRLQLFSLHGKQLTKNWSGQGESDCLIKTKHCEGRKRC